MIDNNVRKPHTVDKIHQEFYKNTDAGKVGIDFMEMPDTFPGWCRVLTQGLLENFVYSMTYPCSKQVATK